jgi:hypothetical protein
MFCAPGHVFGGSEGIRSHIQVLRCRTRFDSREGVGSHFHVLRSRGGSEGVGFHFQVLRSWTRFGGTEGVGSRFNVLRSRTCFQRFRGRREPSCFASPYSFSAIARASGPVFMFCTPGLVFGGSGVVGSRFHVLCSRTRFRRYGGRRVPLSCIALPNLFSAVPRASGPVFMFCAPEHVFGVTVGVGSCFHALRSRTHFRRYRGRQSRFHVLRSRTHFRL